MNIRPGINLLEEIEGFGLPIVKGDRFEAVYKFYYNRGDPIIFDTVHQKPIPMISVENGKKVIGWLPLDTIKSNTVYDFNGWLERQSDIIVGLYYSIIGMKTMGYRRVRIAPHFMAGSLKGCNGIKADSVIKIEIFLLKIIKSAQQVDAPEPPSAAR
jgi:hypothetical protein